MPILWRTLHQLHHSPKRLEIVTSFYQHPLEIISNLDVGASRRLRAWIPVPAERPPGPVVPRVEALSPGPPAADDRVAVVMAPGWSPDPALAARPRPPARWLAMPPASAWVSPRPAR